MFAGHDERSDLRVWRPFSGVRYFIRIVVSLNIERRFFPLRNKRRRKRLGTLLERLPIYDGDATGRSTDFDDFRFLR